MKRLARANAFTLIEMVVAISISSVLIGMAIPRYNDLVRQQEFVASANKLVECLREAQRQAAAPVPTDPGAVASTPIDPAAKVNYGVRWTYAQVVTASNNSVVDQGCTIGRIDDSATFKDLSVSTQANQVLPQRDFYTIPESTLTFDSRNIQLQGGVTPNLTHTVRFYFGVLEKGRLVQVALMFAPGSPQLVSSYSPNGQTLTFSLSSAVDPSQSGVVSIPISGLPIQLLRNN